MTDGPPGRPPDRLADTLADAGEIVLEQDFPNRPETIWKAITTGPLIARWLGMTPEGFAATPGTRFTYRTTPAGAWDGTIHCEVLEAVPNERFAYSWKGGHEGNSGYGSPLDTVVTFTLTPVAGGTRVRFVHAGFRLPRNATAYENMSEGWQQCTRSLRDVANDLR